MKHLIAANWKMHKTNQETKEYFDKFVPLVRNFSEVDIMVAPPFTALYIASGCAKSSSVALGAQNMFFEEKGAYTGEISPVMLKELDVSYVILGHSERRIIFGEKDELINKKVLSAIEHEIRPVLCVGETIEEREQGITLKVIENQIRKGLAGIEGDMKYLDIAYEPVWAIGTGKTATPEQAQEVHQFIRSLINEISKGNDSQTRILYGGSVKPENAKDLISQPDITGFLVGSASLDPEKFYQIIKNSMEA